MAKDKHTPVAWSNNCFTLIMILISHSGKHPRYFSHIIQGMDFKRESRCGKELVKEQNDILPCGHVLKDTAGHLVQFDLLPKQKYSNTEGFFLAAKSNPVFWRDAVQRSCQHHQRKPLSVRYRRILTTAATEPKTTV